MPPPDPFKALTSMASVAIEQGSLRDFAPIPLGADGSTTYGVVFDQFRVLARMARVAAAAGRPLDPTMPPRAGTLVAAYALTCEGRTISPVGVDIAAPRSAPLQRGGPYVKGDAIATVLPGQALPASTLAATYGLGTLRPNDTITISYAEACPSGSATVALPVRYAPSRPIDIPAPALPAGETASSEPVLLQVMIDLDGLLQRPFYVGGPKGLLSPAIDAVRGWRAEPARVNGAPVATPLIVAVRFR